MTRSTLTAPLGPGIPPYAGHAAVPAIRRDIEDLRIRIEALANEVGRLAPRDRRAMSAGLGLAAWRLGGVARACGWRG